MTAATAVPIHGSLPKLEGRLLQTYRLVWCMLAAAAVAVCGLIVFDPATPVLIIAIRLTKSAIVGTIAVILFWRRRHDPVAAILSLALLCWTITSSVDFASAGVWPMVLDRLRFLLFALALLLFPDGEWRPGWTWPMAIVSTAVCALGVVETIGLSPTRLFLPLAIPCVLVAISSLISRFQSCADEIQRQQLKWVALGLVSGIGLILTARAVTGLTGASLGSEFLFQLGIVLVALGFLVPLIRYRLYDAETVMSRSAAYAILTVTLVATFAASEALIEKLGQQFLGSSAGDVSGAIAAAVAAVLLTPLHGRISAWAETRFQADLVHLKADLPEMLWDLPTDWSPAKVGEVALPRIADAVHASRVALYLGGKRIAAHGVHIAGLSDERLYPVRLPLRCPFGGVRGWLGVGPRPDGSLPSKDEREALADILPALRRSLVAAQHREKDRHNDRKLRRTMRDHLAEMEERLGRLEVPVTESKA